ncbi:MAG: HlyD family efflux transporter periplasmic adaptor subunit [Tolumonas sp.]
MRKYIPLFAALGLSACQPATENTLPGYVEGDYIRIATPVAGYLRELAVSEGQQVQTGQPLFRLESSEVSSNQQAAQATLKKAQAQAADLSKGKRSEEIASLNAQLGTAQAALRLSEQELLRQQRLRKQGFSNQATLDLAISSRSQAEGKVRDLKAQLALAVQAARSDLREAAQADITAAEAQFSHADWLQAQTAPTSPVTATVEETLYQLGEWIPAGSPVVTLLAPEAVKIRFYIPETALATIKAGQNIAISCDGSKTTIPARISFIASNAEYTPPVIYSKENRAKLVFMVEARPLDTSTFPLHPGQPVAVALSPTEQ